MSLKIIQRIRTWSAKQIFIVFAAFLVYVLADGTTFSFGLYVDQLVSEYSYLKGKSVLSISTIAASTQSIPLLLSPLVCWWTTKFGASIALLIGCLIAASGYFLPFILQFSKTFWIPAIGYGGFLSVGLTFCYVPAYLTLPLYFEDDRGLATGLAVSGSGVGQVLLAVIVKACILEFGWRGASFITGGLFLFMFISVMAFRPSTSSKDVPAVELTEIVHSDAPIDDALEDEYAEREEIISERVSLRRSRGMTLANVLPMFISPLPIHAGVMIPSRQSLLIRRHSLILRPRARTISTEPTGAPTAETAESTTTTKPTKILDDLPNFRRARSNTIAVPLTTIRRLDASLEQIRAVAHPTALAPIASSGETTSDEGAQSLRSPSPIPSESSQTEEIPTKTKPWILNGRFLLFCLSNFALCLVMGVPYVILPTYISETFGDRGYLASWTLSNVGIASAVGQILLGYLHDRKIFRAWVMYTFAVIISGTSLIVIELFRSEIIILICAFLFGLAISANYALQVLILIDTLSMDHMANAFGILQFCQGLSTLIGIPLQGLLRDLTDTYRLSFLTSGFIIILSGVSMFLWPCLKPMTINKKTMDNTEA